nr:MAG TPA: hypothetical protein [Caudoviricetes sp.]
MANLKIRHSSLLRLIVERSVDPKFAHTRTG